MIGYTYDLTATVANSAIATSLIVEPAQAWGLLGFMLVLSCSLLWFLTQPPTDQQPGADIPPTPVRHPGSRPDHRGRYARSSRALDVHRLRA